LNMLANALAIPAGCLTMLGTSKLKGDSASAELVQSMQNLILSSIFAQTQLEVTEKAAESNQGKAEAIPASPRLKARVRRASRAKKAGNGSVKRKKAARTRS
jgi:hypothetical protein